MEEALKHFKELRKELNGKYKNPKEMPMHDFFIKYAELKQLSIYGVINSYSKEDLRVAFEQARCNKHSFEDWYEFNYC
mgnify:CR=1 FL=1|tara:strand:- start:283 stop:516 length:234 start_codon:yes stop_codon:yes gene_type:complete